ncbi:MAG: hypothetical protein ACOX2I_09590 [Candidatus Ozemobacteraceae bacterium]
MKITKFLQGYVDRVVGNVVVVIIHEEDDLGEESFFELQVPLSRFGGEPSEGDLVPVYNDKSDIVVINSGDIIYCEVEFLLIGGGDEIKKALFEEKCKLSGLYNNRTDFAKIKKARKKFWRLCLKEKNFLEKNNPNKSVFIKKSTYWTNKFDDKEQFTSFAKYVGYEPNQNMTTSEAGKDTVPNTF